MATVQIMMKSGSLIEAQVSAWEFEKTALGKKFSWESDGLTEGDVRLVHVDLEEVAAILEVQ